MRRRGRRTTAAGVVLRFDCIAPDGTRHWFPLPDPASPAPARARTRVQCTRHADGRVQRKGKATTKAGTWDRYRCIRPNGDKHDFQAMDGPDGSVLTSLTKPPACTEHPESKVTRHGTFGRGDRKRQRYWCVPDDGQAPHSFTPPLSRQAVAVGSEACTTCDELLSPHRGALNGARHQSWPLPVLVLALGELAAGESYAAVSVRMRERRDLAIAHLREAHGLPAVFASQPFGTSESTGEGQNAWQLAANLVEQYAPLITTPVFDSLKARERRQRAINDEALAGAPGAGLVAPITWVLDEQPVPIGRRREAQHQRSTWSLLIVVDTQWRPAPDPMTLPAREHRLRLVRAYPMATTEAWELVLQEVGVEPDFIVADSGTAIAKAVKRMYGSKVGVIPSLFHVLRALRTGLLKHPPAVTRFEGRPTLIDALAKPLDALTRDQLPHRTPPEWASWWDELIETAADLGVPTGSLHEQRRLYEPALAAALPLLAQQPQLPASNAAVEVRIRTRLEPFLTVRGQLYRNLARTNFLMDLAVARDQGAFHDPDALGQLIRADNEAAGGWAPTPRLLTDTQPPPRLDGSRARYASLLNPLIVDKLHKMRLGGDEQDQP